MTMVQTHIAIPLPLAQAIADYLTKRPYCEVAELLRELRERSVPHTVPPAPVPDTESGEGLP